MKNLISHLCLLISAGALLVPISSFGQSADSIMDRGAAAPAPVTSAPDSGTPSSGSSSTPSGGLQGDGPNKDDCAGQGLDDALSSITAQEGNILTTYNKGLADAANIKVAWPTFSQIDVDFKKYSSSRSTCISRQSTAAYACLENLSPTILDGVSTVNTLASTLGTVAVSDQCSALSKIMNVAKAAMTTYTAACGVAKAACGLSCVSSRGGLQDLLKAIAKGPSCTVVPNSQTGAASCEAFEDSINTEIKALITAINQELNATVASGQCGKSIAAKAAVCTEKYAQLGVSAVSGIGSLALSLTQGQNCAAATSATLAPLAAADPCVADPNSQACICQTNPMLTGCPSAASQNSAGTSTLGVASGTNPAGTSGLGTGLTNADLSTGDTGIQQAPLPTPGADGTAGPPTGGGSGMGGSSAPGGSGPPVDKAAAQKSLNTNILGGTSGAAGGSGAWGVGSGGGNGSGQYKAYLPGGEKDPNKLGGQQVLSKEVTGQGGKSNWEKVRDRYRDNKSSLLNN